MAPATVADVPDLMTRCRQGALAGDYSAALQLHSQARAAIKSLLITLGSSEEERVRKAKWMGLILELDAEIQLVKVRCAGCRSFEPHLAFASLHGTLCAAGCFRGLLLPNPVVSDCDLFTSGSCFTSQDVAAELAAIPAVPHGAVAVHRPRQNSSSGGVAFTVGSSSCDTPATAARSAAAVPPMTSLAAAAAARQARLELGHNLGMSPHRSDSPQLVTSFDNVAPERDPD
eukprot:844-Heterococcus_DN1.PRE.6